MNIVYRIQVFRSDGTLVRKLGSNRSRDGQFQNPRGITFSPDGLLSVFDYSHHRIQVFQWIDDLFIYSLFVINFQQQQQQQMLLHSLQDLPLLLCALLVLNLRFLLFIY